MKIVHRISACVQKGTLMEITVHAMPGNKKNILDLIEEQHNLSLPCNCHGANSCGGIQYDFPCSLIPEKDITVSIPERKDFHGLSLDASQCLEYMPDTLLIDLGTTTVAMVYYNTLHQTVFCSEVFPNPQLPFGPDVISRIKYDVEFHDEHTLKNCICDELSKRYDAVVARHKNMHIRTCLIGGNTTMIHLLSGLSLKGMMAAPFSPCSDSSIKFEQKYGDTTVILLPWLSAFIGGDILSGMLHLDFDKRSDTCLLADLGTNGELALLYKKQIYMTGTAAGPAFEGGGLKHGIPAVPGAICDITLGKVMPRPQTIGNKLPTGICGSGAISILSELLSCGYMDPSGILTSKFPEEGLVICKNKEAGNILFTADDVRQMQLAIAAIGAGIDTLCHRAGINTNQIDHVYLAGGLGYHINIQKAAMTGLLSDVSLSNVTAVGNSCLHGLASLSDTPHLLWERTHHIRLISNEIVLANDDFFQSQFIRHMTY